jgi:RNA polymerase sigma-70 factor (ECF subfamily)
MQRSSDAERGDAARQGPADVAALLQAAARGDERAWRAIVDLYARRIYALAKSRLGRGQRNGGGSGGGIGGGGAGGFGGVAGWGGCEIAEEVTQSVFVTVASKLVSGGYTEQGRFEAWLFRVAMNRIRDEARRAKRRAETFDSEGAGEMPGEEAAQLDEDRAAGLSALRTAMGQLGDADREVIELRHHAGLSFKQIAELLEEPLGTLLARHHRALRKLKELLTAGGAAPALAGMNGGE